MIFLRTMLFVVCALFLPQVVFSERAIEFDHEEIMAFKVDHQNKEHHKIDCLMLYIGKDKLIEDVCKIMKFDLEFTDQLSVSLKHAKKLPSERKLSKLYDRGTSLYFDVKRAGRRWFWQDKTTIQVSVKDPATSEVIFKKKYDIKDGQLVYASHGISDDLMPVLTGNRGPLLSTIAYCKQLGPRQKVVCISDYAGLKEKVLVSDEKINVAPRWHSRAPLLFYSQFTNRNCLLKSKNLVTKKERVICSYDGMSMQPSFSEDGKQAVLCLSSGGNSELYMYDQGLCNKLGKRVFKRLTKNGGNNVSPCLLKNGDIVFCSDYEGSLPQIYKLDARTKAVKRLTSGRGYCSGPALCLDSNVIVYSRKVNRILQLFKLDMSCEKPVETQLTFNEGNKIEPSWSACGNYVTFAYGRENSKYGENAYQVAVLNMMSGRVRVITKGNETKSYPCWTKTPLYQA